MASLFGQENMIPAFLKSRGIDLTAKAHYAPGQTLSGHIENNLGRVTEVQREEIEKGRVGGWFSDEKCDWFYETYRALEGVLDRTLSASSFDVAFIITGSKEAVAPDQYETFRFGRKLCTKLRESNPDVQIVFMQPWTRPTETEQLPRRIWVFEKLALENHGVIAPVGEAFHAVRENHPAISMHRSAKDPHQNEEACFLIAYTCIAAWTGCPVDDLPNQFTPATGETYTLDEPIADIFRKEAWRAFHNRHKRLQQITVDDLKEPVVLKSNNEHSSSEADQRILVIGNADIGADGYVWREVANGFESRQQRVLHMEDLTDDAATFQSVLANNAGKLTSRQERIVDRVTHLQTQMGKTDYDMDELDGMGDYPIQMIRERFIERIGRLDRVLSQETEWEAVLLVPFRGVWAPEEHDFFEAGRALTEKIRTAFPAARLFLLEPPPPKTTEDSFVNIGDQNCKKLADECGCVLVSALTAWRRHCASGQNLYAGKYKPNLIGAHILAQAIIDKIMTA